MRLCEGVWEWFKLPWSEILHHGTSRAPTEPPNNFVAPACDSAHSYRGTEALHRPHPIHNPRYTTSTPTMGRYHFRPLRVHQTATQLLSTQKLTTPPPWFDTVAAIPPAQALVRPLLRHRSQRSKNSRNKKPSRMFQPQRISYPEDALRREFFGDHPWELARPRVVLEDDGRDAGRWDWSRIQQVGRRLDGESVVQRQMWLMQHANLSKQAAYDKARREFYHFRHLEDVERRVAKGEALATGAYFGKTALGVGMELEDKAFEDWKAWAMKEVAALKQAQGAMYTGIENDDAVIGPGDSETVEGLQEVEGSVPNNERGQLALGGAALRP